MEKTTINQEVTKGVEHVPHEKGEILSPTSSPLTEDHESADDWYEGKPTPEELDTLRRVPGKLPWIAYTICFVEFAERASYYGVQSLLGNFINRPLPPGGNGYGAPPRGTQETGGALGMGTVKANAIGQSFNALVYLLPVFFGWLADAKLGRFKVICLGVAVCGLSHVLMVASTAPSLLKSGNAKAPYFISLYMLSIGAAMFKPCISPMLLDQMRTRLPVVVTNKKGERVIEDPAATTERVMLWFYLLINIGGFFGVATSYCEKYVGWYLAFLLPLVVYLPLPLLLWYLRKRLIMHPPKGSELPKLLKVVGICLRRGGLLKIGRHGFWELAKPSNIQAAGLDIRTNWDDMFVDDVARFFQACGIFSFFPIQYINDNGLGQAANYLSTMLTTNGVPNDVIYNVNSLAIIVSIPFINYGLYPFLRKIKVNYGSASKITTGLFISTVGGAGYAILNHYAYQQSPCGNHGSSDCTIGTGVAPITIWYEAIPYGLGGFSEIFVNVPAYGLAYSKAPVNLRGLLSAMNLFSTGVAYLLGLICSSAIKDPHLTWVFAGPAIVGAVLTVVFYFMFRHIDKEEYVVESVDEIEKVDGHAPRVDGMRRGSVVTNDMRRGSVEGMGATGNHV